MPWKFHPWNSLISIKKCEAIVNELAKRRLTEQVLIYFRRNEELREKKNTVEADNKTSVKKLVLSYLHINAQI